MIVVSAGTSKSRKILFLLDYIMFRILDWNVLFFYLLHDAIIT